MLTVEGYQDKRGDWPLLTVGVPRQERRVAIVDIGGVPRQERRLTIVNSGGVPRQEKRVAIVNRLTVVNKHWTSMVSNNGQ